ncbi:hypothetical protein QM298_00430 [Pseudomonas mendocina]|nr:hypothetical protein [Pseudomonas mendocina]MDV5859462.1 hypothetical protein [Pseudomonas mendocina]
MDEQGFRRILNRNVGLPLALGLAGALFFALLIGYLLNVVRWVEHTLGGFLLGLNRPDWQVCVRMAASGLCLCSSTAMVQATPKSPSGGRVESPWKGLSDMDVARAAMGQGWPFVSGPHPVVPLER